MRHRRTDNVADDGVANCIAYRRAATSAPVAAAPAASVTAAAAVPRRHVQQHLSWPGRLHRVPCWLLVRGGYDRAVAMHSWHVRCGSGRGVHGVPGGPVPERDAAVVVLALPGRGLHLPAWVPDALPHELPRGHRPGDIVRRLRCWLFLLRRSSAARGMWHRQHVGGGGSDLRHVAGTYQPSVDGGSSCLACPAGSYCPARSGAPQQCAPGSFSSAGGLGACVDCSAGEYQKAGASTTCDACDAGGYCAAGASSVTLCHIGTWSNATRVGSIGGCIGCPAGGFCGQGAVLPTQCPAGTHGGGLMNLSSVFCAGTCPIDEITDVGPRQRVSSTGTVNVSGCVCQVGFYLRTSTDECMPCPDGADCLVSGVTLERLPLRRGWWRVGPTSADIRECDPPEACTGGTPSPATSTSI